MGKVGSSTGQPSASVQYNQSSKPSGQVQESKKPEQSTSPSENSQSQKASKQEATTRFSDYQLEGQTRQTELNSKFSADNAVFKFGESGAKTVLVGETGGPEEYSDTDGSYDYDTTTGAEDMPPADYEENSNWVYKEESVPETESLKVELMVEEQTNALNKMAVDAFEAEKAKLEAEKAKLAEKAEVVQAKMRRTDRREAIQAAIEQYGIDTSNINGKPKYGKSLGRNEGRTSATGQVEIGEVAFKRSPGYLASTIGHEAQHAKQIAEGRWYTGKGKQAEAINEVECYDWELKNASKHGLTEEDINVIKGRREEQMAELNPVYKERVEKGNYSWP